MPISLIKIFTTHVLQWYFPLLLIQIRYTPVIIFTSWFLLPLNCYGSYFCLGPVIYGSLLSVSVFLLIEIKMLKGGSVSLVFLVFVTLGSIVLCVLSVWGVFMNKLWYCNIYSSISLLRGNYLVFWFCCLDLNYCTSGSLPLASW